MADTTVEEAARPTIDRLPEDATWEDLAHVIMMHERLARARRDSAAGLGVPLEELEKEFGFTG